MTDYKIGHRPDFSLSRTYLEQENVTLNERCAALEAEVTRLRAEQAIWNEIREPAFLWADCQHVVMRGDMFPDEQDARYDEAYSAQGDLEGDLYSAIIARIPTDWNPTQEQAPWRVEYHPRPETD